MLPINIEIGRNISWPVISKNVAPWFKYAFTAAPCMVEHRLALIQLCNWRMACLLTLKLFGYDLTASWKNDMNVMIDSDSWIWYFKQKHIGHHNDVTMGTMASQITSLTIVYSTVYSGAHQRKHQSSASLAFLWGIHRGPVNSPHQWLVTRERFPFGDVIMWWVMALS